MKILFIHQNMPGQFKHLAPDCVERGHDVVFLSHPNGAQLKGVRKVEYKPGAKPASDLHRWMSGIEPKLHNGQTVARAIEKLRSEHGFTPDLIIGHTGWGEMLFLKDVLPKVPAIGYYELYYRETGYYAGFDPEFPAAPDYGPSVRMSNIANHIGLTSLDRGISPTHWQKNSYPELYHPKIEVLHEGVDTAALVPNPDAALVLPDGTHLTSAMPIITYVVRNLEPVRGFHIMARATEKLLRRNPDVHVVMIGGDRVSYGPGLAEGKSYKNHILAGVELDPKRVHFLGQVPYAAFRDVLHISSAHVYLTYPFILSWSMLEAMAAECLVVGSRTGPVEEVIDDGVNGFLVDFFDIDGLVDRLLDCLDHPERFAPLRRAARQAVVERYDLTNVTLPRMRALIAETVA